MLRDEILAVSRDRLDVLQQLQPLEMVVVVNPHAFADDLQHIHDAEWIITLVRAQLAVVGMIDRDQRVDTGAFGGIELVSLQLAPIGGKRAEIIAHQSDRRLVQIDQLHPRHGAQDVLGGFDHALDTGVPVQGDAHVNGAAEQWPQPVEIAPKEQHEGSHLERSRAAGLLDRRQRGFGELHVATRTPGHDLPGFAARELVQRALGHAA